VTTLRPELVPAADGKRHKRFRLSMLGADEDVPRLARAYGRACDGEFGLVMRPIERSAVLVLVHKDGSAHSWKADEQDALSVPTTETTAAAAVAEVKQAQKDPPKPGSLTLRGRWTGYLYCEGGQPRIELKRKLATYGTLWVFCTPGQGWSWTFERAGKWFGDEGTISGNGSKTLVEAIKAAVMGSLELVQEACGFRDTHRRAAHDEGWADKHPIRKREPKRNPVDRLREPKPKETRTRGGKPGSPSKPRRAPAPRSVNSRDAAPEIPQDTASLQEMTEKAGSAGAELAAHSDVATDWERLHSPVEIAGWFEQAGFSGIAEAIVDYAEVSDYPLTEFLANVGKDLRAAETVHDDDPDPKLYAEAREKITALGQALTSAPVLLERVRKLIRYARSMARSPLCKGREQKAALAAIDEARTVYEATRAKIRQGHTWNPDRTLRRVGDKVALAAAKTAKSCAAGQTTLPKPAPGPATPPAQPKPARRRRSPSKPGTNSSGKNGRATASGKPSPKAPEADAAKDRALIDAFSQAFAAVLGDEAA
jgi:hypothetical protein